MKKKEHISGRIRIFRDRCKGCGFCINACSKGLIDFEKDFNRQGFYPAYQRSENGCTGCALCAVSCPDVAIEVYRKIKVKTFK